MAETPRSLLIVEGTDDVKVLRNLLIRQGVDYDLKPWPEWYPSIDTAGSQSNKEEVLKGMRTAIVTSPTRRVGFVLDANSSLRDSWRSVATQLKAAAVSVPDHIPRDGFVGLSSKFRTRVGVWIMPDNERVGAVEEFVRTLIHSGDSLLPYAESCTGKATEHGARFAAKDEQKAVLHAWLAWQKKPGRPYGTAIRAGFLGAHSPVADRFVSWFRLVFEPTKE